MRILSRFSAWLVVLAAMVAGTSIPASAFNPMTGQETVPLIEGKEGSGTIVFSAATVRRDDLPQIY